MIEISKRQFSTLGGLAQERFERQMAAHLRRIFPSQTSGYGDEALSAFAHRGIETCRPYGIVNEFDVQRFLEYLVIYGRDFVDADRLPGARDILEDGELTGSLKMDRIDALDAFR